jgi:carboxylesterase type B
VHLAQYLSAPEQRANSASVAVLLALNSPDELFQHAFCLSGNPLMYPILPLAIAELNAAKALAALGLADLSTEEQIQRLIATSPDDLLSKVHPSIHMGPTIDDAIRGPPSYENLANSLKELPGTTWCSSLFIGSMDLDAHIFSFLGLFNNRGPVASAFIDRFKKAVPSDKLDALFAVYGLTPATPDDAAQLAILKFGTDLKYFSTGLAYARAWPGKSYLYQFKEVNTWDGPFKGHAGHVLDVAYLFQNYNHELTEEQAKVAKLFGRDLAVFAHAEDPFPTFAEGKGGRVYGSGASAAFVPDADSLGPSGEVQKLWEDIGIQDLSQAWDLFLTRQ